MIVNSELNLFTDTGTTLGLEFPIFHPNLEIDS